MPDTFRAVFPESQKPTVTDDCIWSKNREKQKRMEKFNTILSLLDDISILWTVHSQYISAAAAATCGCGQCDSTKPRVSTLALKLLSVRKRPVSRDQLLMVTLGSPQVPLCIFICYQNIDSSVLQMVQALDSTSKALEIWHSWEVVWRFMLVMQWRGLSCMYASCMKIFGAQPLRTSKNWVPIKLQRSLKLESQAFHSHPPVCHSDKCFLTRSLLWGPHLHHMQTFSFEPWVTVSQPARTAQQYEHMYTCLHTH